MHLSSASQQMLFLICLVGFLCVFTSGVISHDSKKPTCCKKTMLREPQVNISKCEIFPEKGKCVAAVALTDDKKRMYCINPKAKWLKKRLENLEENGVICKKYT